MLIDQIKGDKMKKLFAIPALLILGINLFSQLEQHQVYVTNIEVPIRVFDKGTFVNDLTLQDFELYEDGKLQKIEALYYINKDQIQHTELKIDFMPFTGRIFYLIFQMTDYNPRLAETIDYLFEHVLLPDDSLSIVTPLHNYNLSPDARKRLSQEKISKELIGLIRKDTITGGANYRNKLRDLKRMARSLSGTSNLSFDNETSADSQMGISIQLERYMQTLEELENLRKTDVKFFLSLASNLKRQAGQKHIFYFYQREFTPQIPARVLNNMMTLYQDKPNVQSRLQDLFGSYHRNISVKVEPIKHAFADSSMLFNFIFMNKRPENTSGIEMQEQSEDIFKILTEAAKSTGGIVDNSQNPLAAFKNVTKLTEKYYLLYYSPANYMKDGEFKNIVVKVKGKDYKIINKQGYYAK